jgi:hypothetical protein
MPRSSGSWSWSLQDRCDLREYAADARLLLIAVLLEVVLSSDYELHCWYGAS